MPDLLACLWELGSSNGGMTPINAVLPSVGDMPSALLLLGVTSSWELAEHIVKLHNESVGA